MLSEIMFSSVADLVHILNEKIVCVTAEMFYYYFFLFFFFFLCISCACCTVNTLGDKCSVSNSSTH